MPLPALDQHLLSYLPYMDVQREKEGKGACRRDKDKQVKHISYIPLRFDETIQEITIRVQVFFNSSMERTDFPKHRCLCAVLKGSNFSAHGGR